jgi:hypothetical protein
MLKTSTILDTALVSEDWELAEKDFKPAAVMIQQRKGVTVLPWFRFVYADGDNSRVEMCFASHLVAVTGGGLAALLLAVANQRVVRLSEPTGNEARFGVRGLGANSHNGPAIHEITVHKFEGR